MTIPPRRPHWITALLFTLCLLPFLWLSWLAMQQQLGTDPAKQLVDQLGLWAMRLLWLTLAMTPLRLLTHHSFWIRQRRMFGLFTLTYASMHVLAYVFLLFGARWPQLLHELTRRPYVIVGTLAVLSLLPLGITSTRNWQRRLGRRWLQLHRLVYLIAVLTLLHFIWVNKLGLYTAWPYALILLLLFGIRLWHWHWRRQQQRIRST